MQSAAARASRGVQSCTDPRHTPAGDETGAEDDRTAGDRPVSLAGATLRAVAARLAGDLERTRDALTVLTDSEQLEAELAAVRADTQAEISHAAQQEAAARRDRMQADEAAEVALAGRRGSRTACAVCRRAPTRRRSPRA